MPELLDIKCARIWAFDEMIDTNTYHDGLSTRLSIQQLKYTLNMIICKKDTMTEYIDYRDINNDYLDILRKLLIYNNYDRTSILDTINMNPFETVYYSCGWSEHAITIFITNNGDWDEDLGNWNYELGIINCGQGAEFQGCNDISCNGLIIFRNLSYKKIQDFLIMYSTYCTVTEELKYPNFMIYRSFYLLLFNTILGEDIVDFKKPNNNIKFYKIPLQTIGSCFFTNTVIIVYYLYIKKYPGLRDNETYELY